MAKSPSFRLMACLFVCMTLAAFGAEYQGERVDGIRYRGFARPLHTGGKYYPASIVFRQEHANVSLASGEKLDLTLDEVIIEDPEDVLAIDERGLWWALSIDGLNALPNGLHTVVSARSAAPQR